MDSDRNTTRSGSRGRRGLGAAIALAVVLGALAGLVPARAADAAASGITSIGSIVHVKGNDVWLTSPDGATNARVTSNGGTPDPGGMGDKPYFSPSQSDAGDVIVAVRNQLGSDGWTRGYLWVMNRNGTVIRKFAPPQQPFTRSAVGCADFGEAPSGIVTAAVSPDGSKVVYWDRWLVRSTANCTIDDRRALRVVDISNANPKHIVEPDGSSQALSHPSWVSSSRLLVSRDGGVSVVDLPDATARPWFATAAEEGDNFPVLEGDRLATTGPSTWFGEKELRLWRAAGGLATPPTSRCRLTDPVRGFGGPTWAPTGSAVAWQEGDDDGSATTAGEGVWAMPVGDISTACPTRADARLIVPGGEWPSWGPASVDGSPPLITFSVNDVSVVEGASGQRMVTATISRSWGAGTVSVAWFTANGTAVAPGDYGTVGASRVTFGPDEMTKTVSVPVNGDTTVEPNESFFVKLSAPSAGTTIADGTGRATITNDDYSSTFAVNDVSVVEGDSGQRMATFTITRSSGTGAPSVSWFTVNGTATAPSDYQAVSATPVSFAAGQTTKQVSVPVNGDTIIEGNEAFFVRLTAPSAGTAIADGTGRATITNDDAIRFSINDASVAEGSWGGGNEVEFTITRTSGTGTASVSLATVDGTAVAGADYSGASPTIVSFDDGETAKTFTIFVTPDFDVEPNEYFFAKLFAPSANHAIADGTGRGIIVNDDTA